MNILSRLRFSISWIFRIDQPIIQFVFISSMMTFLVTVGILFFLNILWPFQSVNSFFGIGYDALFKLILTNLLIAPIFENALLIFSISILSEITKNNTTLVIVISMFSMLAHGLANQWAFVAGGTLFGLMTYTYLCSSERSFLTRFAMICGQHALFNTPATIDRWLTAA